MIEIKKAAIKDQVSMAIEWSETNDKITHEHKSSFTFIPHADLTRCFSKLNVHMAMLCELVEEFLFNHEHFETGEIFTDVLYAKMFENYEVTGFALGGNNEQAGVSIIGKKKLRGNRVLNLVSPFTKFEDGDGHDNYNFNRELHVQIMECIEEVEQYIEGKQAPNPQLKLEFEEND